MINQQIIEYINQQLENGVDEKQIRNTLLSGGWQANDVDESFQFLLSVKGASVTWGQKLKYIIIGIVIGGVFLGPILRIPFLFF